MVDIFKNEGIEPPKDIFKEQGIRSPSVGERISSALNPVPLLIAPKEAQDDAKQQEELYNQLAESRFSPDQLQEMEDQGPIGFIEAYDFLDFNQVLPGGGFSQAADSFGLLGIAKKMEAGEELDDSETQKMNEYIDKEVTMHKRGLSVGGGIAYYGSQMPAFMVEFALSGGVGKPAQKLAEKSVSKFAQKTILKKTAGISANVAARTIAMPTMYTPTYAERRMNDYMAVTDKGDVILRESKESPAKSAMMALGYTTAEVASEMAGAAIGKYLVKPITGTAKKALKTPMTIAANKLPVKVKQSIYKAVKEVRPNAKISQIFSAGGWNGVIEELGEERLADILREGLNLATDEEMTFQDYLEAITPSTDQLLIEAGIISIAGGARSVSSIAVNILEDKIGSKAKAQELVDNMSIAEQEQFIDDNLKVDNSPAVNAIRPVEQIKQLTALLNETRKTITPPVKKPLIKMIKEMGGVQVGSRFDDELRAMDINPKSHPGLFRKEGGLSEIDNLPANEFVERFGVTPIEDGAGNVDQSYLLEQIRKENFGEVLGATDISTNPVIQQLDELGLDINEVTAEQLHDELSNIEFTTENVKFRAALMNERLTQSEVDRIIAEQEDFANVDDAVESFIERKAILNEEISPIQQQEDIPFIDAFEEAGPIAQAQQKAAPEEVEINENESGWARAYRDWLNILQPIEDLTDDAKAKGTKILDSENPFLLSRNYAGVVGNIRQNLRVNTVALNKETGTFEATGKSLKSIMEDFDNSVMQTEPDIDQREADFGDYLIARRTIEDLVEREDVQVSDKDKIKSSETMQRLALKYGDDFVWFDEFAQEMYDYQRRILHLLVDSDVMSQKQYDEIVKANPNYIPFHRVLEQEELQGSINSKGVFTDAAARKVIKRIYGSDKDIKNTINSVIANTAKIVDISWRNRTAKAVADLAPIMPEYVQKSKTPMKKVVVEEDGKPTETFRPSGQQPKGTIVVYRDGKQEFYKVSKPLLEAMESMSDFEQSMSLMAMHEWLLHKPARLVRAGATLVPEFWVRNGIRDQFVALLQAGTHPIQFFKGLQAVVINGLGGNSKLYNEWEASGGSFNSYMDLDDKGIQKAYKELFRPDGKFYRYTKNPINLLADISMGIEQATRIGVYQKMRKKGMSGLEAALQAREATLDFARGGKASKKINRAVPFFNAGMQATDKMIRTFRENPKGVMMYGLGSITMPQILLTGYYLYAAPEEERQDYLEIPQWQKDIFWVFKAGDTWLRIPKPFSYGYLFGSTIERFMIWSYDGEKPEVRDGWWDLVRGIGGAFSPVYDLGSVIPPLPKLAIETITNHNFFMGRNIYPEWMERFVPEERKNKFTSETSQLIGDAFNVSPAALDNAFRGIFATSSRYGLLAGDKIINSVKEWNGEDLAEKPFTKADTPFIWGFAVREPTGMGTQSGAAWFRNWEDVSQVQNTFKNKQGEERQEFREKNQNKINAYNAMKGINKSIRSSNKRANAIWDDTTMSSKDKLEALSDIGDEFLEKARRGNELYKENVK